jgi:hypothetical protein
MDRLIFINKGVATLAVSNKTRNNTSYRVWPLSEKENPSVRSNRNDGARRTVDTVEWDPPL